MTDTHHSAPPPLMSGYRSLWDEIESACDTLYTNIMGHKDWTGLERVLSPCNKENQKSYGALPIPFDLPRSDQEIVENDVFAIKYRRIEAKVPNQTVDIKKLEKNTHSIVAAKKAMARRKFGEHLCLEVLYHGSLSAFLWNELTGELIKLPKNIWSTPQAERALISQAPGLWQGETGTVLGVVDSSRILIKKDAMKNAASYHYQHIMKKHEQANATMKIIQDREGTQKNQSNAIGYREVVEILYQNAPSWINDDSWNHWGFIHNKGKAGEWEATALAWRQTRISMSSGDWNRWKHADFDCASGEATGRNGRVYSKLLWNRNEVERDRYKFHDIILQHNSILKADLLGRIEKWNKNRETLVDATAEPQKKFAVADSVKPENDPKQVLSKVAMACDIAIKKLGQKHRQIEIVEIIREQYCDDNSLPATNEISAKVITIWLGKGREKEPDRKTFADAVKAVRSALSSL